jgi:predicted RNA binding protein YcfA (HicA-like mRNA interferase family)
MSTKLPVVSGTAVVRALERAGWAKHSQIGSYVKDDSGRRARSVPLHDPVKRGPLASILRTVEMTADELRQLLEPVLLAIKRWQEHGRICPGPKAARVSAVSSSLSTVPPSLREFHRLLIPTRGVGDQEKSRTGANLMTSTRGDSL